MLGLRSQVVPHRRTLFATGRSVLAGVTAGNAVPRRWYADQPADDKKDRMAQLASMQRIAPTAIGVYTGTYNGINPGAITKK